MATRLVKTVTPLEKPSISLIKRSDDAAEIQKCWVGHENSHLGLGKFNLKDGTITFTRFYRQDLILIQFFETGINVFVNPDRTIQIDIWDKETTTLDESDHVSIKKIVADTIATNLAFFERECRYLAWIKDNGPHMTGLTPEEAIRVIVDAGW